MRARTLLLATVAVGLVLLVAAPAMAFHDDGVAHCNGCHTMHNSQNDQPMNFDATGAPGGTAQFTGFDDLLLFANKSDVCLSCHAGNGSYHVWADDPLAPGTDHGAGNFVFLEEDNINDGHGGGDGTCSVATCGGGADPCETEVDCLAQSGVWTWGAEAIPGMSAGHSVSSDMKGTTSDTILTTAPGGTFDSDELGCPSCHDPHGNDSYRLTYREGQTMILSDASTFTWPVGATIDATGIAVFGGSESNANHNAYRSGYSEWCSSCHGDLHQSSGSLIHPSGEFLDTDQIASYNFYNGSTDCATNPPLGGNPCGSGTQATAYLAMVPFEWDNVANTTNNTTGATAASRVSCMSCHRAHATSAPDAGRWDFSVTGLAEDGHESNSWPLPNPYDANQRSLCNKCHSQDEYDAIVNFTP